MLNTRMARGVSSASQLKTFVTTLQDRDFPAYYIEFELREEKVPLPLGWLLSERARKEMQRQFGTPKDCSEVTGIENPCSYGEILKLLRMKIER